MYLGAVLGPRSASKNGSVAKLVQRSGFSWCAEQAGTEQIELGPAVPW